MGEYHFYLDPPFWWQIALTAAVIYLAVRQNIDMRMFARFCAALLKKLTSASTLLEEIGSHDDTPHGIASFMSGQTDVSIHHNHELQRLRESVLELAADLEHLGTLQYLTTHASFPGAKADDVIAEIFGRMRQNATGAPNELSLSNHVFRRHTALPEEFPLETRNNYEAGKWICRFCDSHVDHSWTLWCPNCHRRTFHLSEPSSQPMRSAVEHESTQPGGLGPNTVTCYVCHQVFELTEHPLLASCPHCGTRQSESLGLSEDQLK